MLFLFNLHEENNIYGAFAKEITADEEPIFYELDIEKYLNTFAPPDYQNFIYRMAARMFCRSFSCTFYTSARMGILQFRDGQACIVLFVENIRAKEIDKQREGDARKAPDPAE